MNMNIQRFVVFSLLLLCSNCFAEPEGDLSAEGGEDFPGPEPENEGGTELEMEAGGGGKGELEIEANGGGGGKGASKVPIDCQDVLESGKKKTGVYAIFPKDSPGFKVRCDMNTDGGGWTVIQRRISNSNFYRGLTEYQTGFGDLNTNFWLGLVPVNLLTKQSWYELRVDMIGPTGSRRYAKYDLFIINDVFDKFRLGLGKYSGNAGDSMTKQNGQRFSTKDSDNDANPSGSCAQAFLGAWWYERCHLSNLNGIYGDTRYAKGVVWETFTTHRRSLRQVEMKVRRHPGPPRPAPAAVEGVEGERKDHGPEGEGEDADGREDLEGEGAGPEAEKEEIGDEGV